jgi:hypothetical protein
VINGMGVPAESKKERSAIETDFVKARPIRRPI